MIKVTSADKHFSGNQSKFKSEYVLFQRPCPQHILSSVHVPGPRIYTPWTYVVIALTKLKRSPTHSHQHESTLHTPVKHLEKHGLPRNAITAIPGMLS